MNGLVKRALGAVVMVPAALAASLWWVGCSSDESNGGNTPGRADGSVDGGPGTVPVVHNPLTACEAILRAQCNKGAECNGTKNDCPYLALCPEYQFMSGSMRTVEGLFACAEQIEKEDCETYAIEPLPSCLPLGTLEAGAGCGFHSQCASGNCILTGETCGTCAPVAERNGPCSPDRIECPAGQYCKGGTCEDIALAKRGLPAGSACNGNSGACAHPGSCIQSASSDAGTCMPRRPTTGEQCESFCEENVAHCDSTTRVCRAYLAVDAPCTPGSPTEECVPQSSCKGGKCTRWPGQGQDCSELPCTTGSYCDPGKRCAPAPKAKERCAEDSYCAEGLTCVRDESGVDGGVASSSCSSLAVGHATGEPCSFPAEPCKPLLRCQNGQCVNDRALCGK